MWLLGLLSAAIVAGAVYLGHEWYQRSWGWDDALQQSVFAPDFGWNAPTAMLVAAVVLALVAVAGGPMLKLLLLATKRSGDDPRQARRPPVTTERVQRPDGSELHVYFHGPADAPALVLAHGWGLNSDEWVYTHAELAKHFQVITWDEPGLGHSTRPKNGDFSLEKLASDLRAVLGRAGDRAVLIGHSIGGMMVLTFCRLFPELLGSKVAGLVLAHTTYTNPVRTTKGAAFYSAIEKPILVPLMYLTIALSPLLWLLNWMSYRNGTAHLSNMRSSFAGTESWEQLDFSARFVTQAPPAVLARGMLGMMRYDATGTLPKIPVPVLVVTGDRDGTTKPEAGARMEREIPTTRALTLSPAKHLGLLEHHERFAQGVQEFIRKDLQLMPASTAPVVA